MNKVTNQPEPYCAACDREGATAGGDTTPLEFHTCQEVAERHRMSNILQRVADFDFLTTLNASPDRTAREAYIQLMVDVRLVLRGFQPVSHA